MANFYLEKKSKDVKSNKELFNSFGKLAKEYYSGSKILLQNLSLGHVIASNISFSCELYIKAILYDYGIDFTKTIDKHNLEGLFVLLPEDISKYIKENIIMIEKRDNFELIMHEIGNTFIASRYASERKELSINMQFLFALADILNFVFNVLKKE